MLSIKDTKRCASLIKKIDHPHEGLPQPVFNALLSVVPFVACELVIANKKGILLTWREDKWWRGWHFPGGLLRYKENFKERIQKVARQELGIHIENYNFLFPINFTECTCNHIISLVFLCKTKMVPKDGKFFKKMPKNIIEEHKELWQKIEKKFKF